MEYRILYAQHLLSIDKAVQKLMRLVQEAIALGWEPLGGVAMSEHGTVAQALVKRR